MIKIKFLVVLIYFVNTYAGRINYCEICSGHTLCKYEIAGPSPHCVGYDTDALLTEDDNNAILDKINERRNFISMGHSRYFPPAANMKKIMWSEELATFAQRWVDQCDQSLRPDKADQCRDLDHLEVGQSISTITGLPPSATRYTVKSFVEIWFMESLDYTGSVTYYNQSKNHKTNQFTQLIWANTVAVGCGRAKFFVKKVKPVVVERLVCNFAPKANIHGKPVYIIGYAATQCDNGVGRDKKYPGLCSHQKPKDKLPSSYPSVMLKIRNLFDNDSAEQEIDPIYNNLKQMRKSFKSSSFYNNQNKSYIYHNISNSYDAVKRSYPLINDKLNNSRYIGELQKRDKGHSRIYHGHDHRNEFDFIHPEIINQEARRYDFTNSGLNVHMEQNHRIQNSNQQCTRKSKIKPNTVHTSECVPCKEKTNKCTRIQKNNCEMSTQRCEGHEFPKLQFTTPTNKKELCACNTFLTTYTTNLNRYVKNTNWNYVNVNCPTNPCPYMLRTLRDADQTLDKQNDFQYFNLFPNISQESTSSTFLKILPKNHEIHFDDNSWLPYSKQLKNLDRRKELNRHYSKKKKREATDEENYKPFWQIDAYVNKNQPQLKSIKYTTLPKRKSPKYKRTRINSKVSIRTESITIPYKQRNSNGKHITEKYLSFDELMHLRKQSVEKFSGRRYYDKKQILREPQTTPPPTTNEIVTSQSTEATTEYTFNTPYVRMKYCTRKLTCTWTAASLTDSAGSIIPGVGLGAVGGSRTPPGYVEGCTRTSTCTRDYMNRNKMATLPVEITSSETVGGDEEDYCERRSLNRRSNIDLIDKNKNKNYFLNSVSKQNISLSNETFIKVFNNCFCYNKHPRNKRDNYNKPINFSKYNINAKRESENYIINDNNLLSYGDLYYYVVRKIVGGWQKTNISNSHYKCICNRFNKTMCCNLFLFSTIIFKCFVTLYN